jgi:RecB family exonuclease
LAESIVLDQGAAVLPSSAVLIHGFADVTGLVADFLESLVRTYPTAIFIDRPDRPGISGRLEPGLRFLDRLEARFSDLDHFDEPEGAPKAGVLLTECGDVESEARWVAERARALIEEGVAAEDIGVVARRYDRLAFPLRRHLGRLGVPFSGVGEGVAGGGGRRSVLRLIEFFRAGPATPVDLWIEGREPAKGRTELLLALQQIGVVRLEDVASLRLDGLSPKGVRIHLALGSSDGTDQVSGRWVPPEVIREARREATALSRVFEGWSDVAEPVSHADRTESMLRALGWVPDGDAWKATMSLVRALREELSALPALERQEWVRLLTDRLSAVGDESIGGKGGGIQVLNVIEARARTFEYLFLVGFNRGVFPRSFGDDSLLPDIIRIRLALDVLPEMPVRARSAEEERYLFAQLVSAAPHVEVSWHLAAQGSVMSRSPFVADFLTGEAPDPIAPPVWSTARANLGLRPPWEHAVLAAAGGPRKAFAPILELALSSSGMSTSESDMSAVARSRSEILEEVDPEKPREGINPWFGFVGNTEPGEEDGPPVTTIENVAECPWANFVTRRLGVAPMPDPQLGLPDPRGRLVGEVVHRVLERIVRDALGDASQATLEGARAHEGISVVWPAEEHLHSILEKAAHEVAVEAGLGPLGMAALLAARSRPYLEVARRIEWGEEERLDSVLAAEVRGRVDLPRKDRPFRFRADRVDRDGTGLCLVDYKTGRPASSAQQEKTRRKHLLREVAMGRMLQAAAYAAISERGDARGRYLWLRPDIADAPEEARTAIIGGDEADFSDALAEAVEVVGIARDAGAMFPRVEEVGSDQIPNHCKYCPVAEVCRRDDSGFRRRLVAWMENSKAVEKPVEEAARSLWHLGAEEKGRK